MPTKEDKETTKPNSFIQDLIAAQKELQPVKKEGKNPHYGNDYAKYEDLVEECKKCCNNNNLFITHIISNIEGHAILTTRIIHLSGEKIESSMPLLNKAGTDQGMGSSISYAKRYTLEALMGMSTTKDDDGNAASQSVQQEDSIPNEISTNPGDKIIHFKWAGCTGKKIADIPKAELIKIKDWAKSINKFHDIQDAIEKYLGDDK